MVRFRTLQQQYFAMVEIVTALLILTVTLTVATLNAAMERRRVRALYHRAVAEQVLDGYREMLAAGAWRSYGHGRHALDIDAPAFKALPEGRSSLQLTQKGQTVRLVLEWTPSSALGIGPVRKEAVLEVDNQPGRQP